MTRISKLITLGATLAVFAAPALAQSTTSKECNDENKAAWYDTFLKNRNGDGNQQKAAYDNAKQYLTSCPEDPNDAVAQYLKKWVPAYEKATRKVQFEELFAKKNYAEAMNLGKQILADDPENVRVEMLLGYTGYFTKDSSPSVATESVDHAKRAIQLIESGKAPDKWNPFSGKDEALAWLNYSIGTVISNVKKMPGDALPNLLKAARYESGLKKIAAIYLEIEQAYESGPYARQSDDYKAKYAGKDETPESKLALENINQVVDRMIDAYARAVALAGNDPNKETLMQSLTDWYKFRHKSDTGLSELVAGILSKPLPDVPTPLTSLPAATSTPAEQPASGNAPAPGNAKPAGTTKPNQTASKPPRTRAHHAHR